MMGARNRILHWCFDIGIVAKGLDGVLEIIGSGLLFWVTPAQLSVLVRMLTQHELSEDPHDLVARYLLHASQRLTADAQLFGAIYLLSHGAVKVGLVTALLRRRYWAYPVAIAAFLVFLAYQLYRYTHTHAPELLVLSGFDALVIGFTWLEARRVRAAPGRRGK